MAPAKWVAPLLAAALLLIPYAPVIAAPSRWATRDVRAAPRGPWRGALAHELPRLYREFNGIDFGHAHLGETLLRTTKAAEVDRARLDVLAFIASMPGLPPDEGQIAPTFTRMVWPLERTFDWAHAFHRSLYDLFASGRVKDKRAAYRKLLANYLASPDAITPRPLDHHGKLWSFPESKAFRDGFAPFNSQIWAYHWLQAAAYDVQLLGPAAKQRELMPAILDQYHEYLNKPPTAWRFMPLMSEVAPRFSADFPEAASIFDNLHMLHDNVDDILARRDLFPSRAKQREAILKIRRVYLARNHGAGGPFAEYELSPGESAHGGHEPEGSHSMEVHGEMVMHGSGGIQGMEDMGPRPPSADDVLKARGGR
jgi:hypothetical protein